MVGAYGVNLIGAIVQKTIFNTRKHKIVQLVTHLSNFHIMLFVLVPSLCHYFFINEILNHVKNMIMMRNLPLIVFSVPLLMLLLINQENFHEDFWLAQATKWTLFANLVNSLVQAVIIVKY